MVNTFDLRPDPSGGFDFVIDSLFLTARLRTALGAGFGAVTLMRRDMDMKYVLALIQQLKGEARGDLPPDRVWLYVCPVCYDEDCDGISARIQVESDHVTWSDFFNGLPPEPVDDPDDNGLIEELGAFVFKRDEYEAALDRTFTHLRHVLWAGMRTTEASKQVTLGVERLISRRSQRKGNPNEVLHWTIDGRPLVSILGQATPRIESRTGQKLASGLVHSVIQERNGQYGETGRAILRAMLGEAVFEDLPGRVPFLVGECLDILRGAITARVNRSGPTVVWDDFRVHSAGLEDPGHTYPGDISFTFDIDRHDATLRQTLDLLRIQN